MVIISEKDMIYGFPIEQIIGNPIFERIVNPLTHKFGDFPTRILKKMRVNKKWNPSQVFVFDIETWGLDATKFSIGGIKSLQDYLDGKPMMKFTDKKDMKEWIISQEDKSIFYAHNAEYDMAGLWEINEFREMMKIYPNRLICAFTSKPDLERKNIDWNSGIQIRDSWSLFSYPLSKLGEDLGFEKGETPVKFIRGRECEIEQNDWDYLERDLDILCEALTQLQSTFSEWINTPNSNLPMTAASLAYSVFSQAFWPEEWKGKKQIYRNGNKARICPDNCKDGRRKIFHEKECPKCGKDTIFYKKITVGKVFIEDEINRAGTEAYYGGRTQVIKEPTKVYENVVCYDANSLYPSVMLNNEYPCPKHHYIEHPSISKLMRTLARNDRLVIANLMLNGENSNVQFLPSTDELGRRNYTEKTFNGWLCEPEIKAAIERGWIVESVENLYSFEPISPFKDFVNFFYNLRKEYQKNNDNREAFCKLILNSLYGKFGQKDIRNRIENKELIDEITLSGEEWYLDYDLKNWDHFQGVYLMEIMPTKMCENTFAPIAAFVTSYARVFLQEVIENTDAIYCDTDSIFTTKSEEEINRIIPLGNELNQWKKEGENAPYMRFWEPKVYQKFDENMETILVKHKGANRSDGDLTKTQYAEMMNKYRFAVNNPEEKWGKFRTVGKESKRFFGKEIN